MLQTLARAIVHRYPAAWRARYADEVVALIGVGTIRLRDVLDLLRGCIRERVLALYEPSRHISAFRLISGIALIAWIAILLAGSLMLAVVPFGVGYLLQITLGPFPEDVMDTVAWLYLPLFLGVVVWSFVGFFRLRFASLSTGRPLPAAAAKFRWILLTAYGVLYVLNGMTTDLAYRQIFSPVLMMWFLIFRLHEPPNEIRWPGDGLFEALGRLRTARYDLRWARMELDRCEGIYVGREPGPELRAARAEMNRLTAEEAGAMASLDAMGYHARFDA